MYNRVSLLYRETNTTLVTNTTLSLHKATNRQSSVSSSYGIRSALQTLSRQHSFVFFQEYSTIGLTKFHIFLWTMLYIIITSSIVSHCLQPHGL